MRKEANAIAKNKASKKEKKIEGARLIEEEHDSERSKKKKNEKKRK